jgi:hypothetical protein
MPGALREPGKAVGEQLEIEAGIRACVTQSVGHDRQVCAVSDQVSGCASLRRRTQSASKRDVLLQQAEPTTAEIGALYLTTDRGW